MTAKTLEREAREKLDNEAAIAATKADRQWNATLGPQTRANYRSGFRDGYRDAATLRGKEIEELRAKLEAVPVEEIRRRNQSHILDGADAEDVDAIDRWLATVTK